MNYQPFAATVLVAVMVLLFGNAVRRGRIMARIWPRKLTVPNPRAELPATPPTEHETRYREVLARLRGVRNWTMDIQSDQEGALGTRIGDERIEQWMHIATEVRLRKTLILAAAHDLGQAVNDLSKHCDVSLRVSEIAAGEGSQFTQPSVGAPTPERGTRDVAATAHTGAVEQQTPVSAAVPSSHGTDSSPVDSVKPEAPQAAAGAVSDGNADEPRADHLVPEADRPYGDDRVVPNVLVMAATDVFAEKAQKTLTDRARWLIALGSIVGTIAVVSLASGAYLIAFTPVTELFGLDQTGSPEGVQPGDPDPTLPRATQDTQRSDAGQQSAAASLLDFKNHAGYFVTLAILQRVTVSGLLLGAVYLLVMVARALLHEAMVLYGRRHSLRFGRLYVYTKLGHVTYGEMEKAFGWSSEHRSAFADIRGEKVSKNLVQVIADVAKEVAKSTATAVSEVAKTKKA